LTPCTRLYIADVAFSPFFLPLRSIFAAEIEPNDEPRYAATINELAGFRAAGAVEYINRDGRFEISGSARDTLPTYYRTFLILSRAVPEAGWRSRY